MVPVLWQLEQVGLRWLGLPSKNKNYMKKLSRFTTFARNHLLTYLGQFSPQFLCLQGLLNIS